MPTSLLSTRSRSLGEDVHLASVMQLSGFPSHSPAGKMWVVADDGHLYQRHEYVVDESGHLEHSRRAFFAEDDDVGGMYCAIAWLAYFG